MSGSVVLSLLGSVLRSCDCLVSRLTPGTMRLLLAMSGSVVLPQLGSVFMSVAYVTTGAYANHVCRCEGSVELPMPLTILGYLLPPRAWET